MLCLDFQSAPQYVSLRVLGEPQVPELQALYERCEDYVLMVTGEPPTPAEAMETLNALPPGRTFNDKIVVGVYERSSGRLVGMIDIVVNHPNQGDAWIGLLMLEPGVRSRGLGSQIYRWLAEELQRAGIRNVWLGVLQGNPSAEVFWKRAGFSVVEERMFTSRSGQQQMMRVLRHPLGERPGRSG